MTSEHGANHGTSGPAKAGPRLVLGSAPGAAPSEQYDPALDIALDEVLLELGRRATRVWTPLGRAVVIGVASKAAGEVRLQRARAARVPVRRRPSGGAAVLLSPEVVCFGLVLPYAEHEEAGTIGGAYRLATSAVARALGELGLETTFEPPGDIAAGGRKIAGFAQARRRTAALVHGVVPVSVDGAELERFLGAPAEEPAYRRGRPHSEFVTDLRRELGGCRRADVERALAKALAGEAALPEGFSAEEMEKARSLADEKYLRDEWNLRR